MTRHRFAFPREHRGVPGQVHEDVVRLWVFRALAGTRECLTGMRDQMPPSVSRMLTGLWCPGEGGCGRKRCRMKGALQERMSIPRDQGQVAVNARALGRELGLSDVQVQVLALAAVSCVQDAVRDVVGMLVYQGVEPAQVVSWMLEADEGDVQLAMAEMMERGLLTVGRRVDVDDDDDDDEEEETPW